jgi:hypothetical protein
VVLPAALAAGKLAAMKRLIGSLLLSFSFMAAAQAPATGRVIFYQVRYGIQGFGIGNPIWIDGEKAMVIMPGTRAEAILPAGAHRFRAGAKAYELVVNVKPGGLDYLRFDFNTNGWAGTKFLTEVDAETAALQCQRTKPAKRDSYIQSAIFIEPRCN